VPPRQCPGLGHGANVAAGDRLDRAAQIQRARDFAGGSVSERPETGSRGQSLAIHQSDVGLLDDIKVAKAGTDDHGDSVMRAVPSGIPPREPCGVQGQFDAARQDERFVVFGLGGGTLDVSAVRLDLTKQTGRKAVQLGQAGCDLGGMDIDRWRADDFCARHGASDADRRDLENMILRQAEAVKIQLSDPDAGEAETTLMNDLDYLLTWNCSHIANAAIRHKIDQACRENGFEPPIICTPEELLED